MENMGMVSADLRMILANIANFLILFFIVKHFFYNKIKSFMESRSVEIKEQIDEAAKVKFEAEDFKSEYMEKLRNIEHESREIIKDATAKANDKKHEIVKQAEDEAQSIFQRNQKEIAREKEKAIEELKGNMIDLSMDAASKIIGAELDKEKHQVLIANIIEEAGESK